MITSSCPRPFSLTSLLRSKNATVGCVGTKKRVRRIVSDSFLANYFNILGCLYLTRHSFDIARHQQHRRRRLHSVRSHLGPTARQSSRTHASGKAFTDEYLQLGWFGRGRSAKPPTTTDCITRWMVNHGWRIQDIIILGARLRHHHAGHVAQVPSLPIARAGPGRAGASNARSLLSARIRQRQWYCVYAVLPHLLCQLRPLLRRRDALHPLPRPHQHHQQQ